MAKKIGEIILEKTDWKVDLTLMDIEVVALLSDDALHVSTLENSRESFARQTFRSPSLIIIGDVVHYHRQYAWSRQSMIAAEYFEPVS